MPASRRGGKRPATAPTANQQPDPNRAPGGSKGTNGRNGGLHRQNGIPDGRAVYRHIAAIGDGLSARADHFGW